MAEAAANLPSRWAPDRDAFGKGADSAPQIAEADIQRVSDSLDIWDAWPVQNADGMPALLAGGDTLWMALAAPRFDDPDDRHSHARIHLFLHRGGRYTAVSPAMPDGFSPGSREWSGSAVLDPDQGNLTLYFTATGRRGESKTSFEQRLFRASATLAVHAGLPALVDWRGLDEFITRDSAHYMASDSGVRSVGTIKAFRDPAYFFDPQRQCHHIFFAASLPHAASAFNGAIGHATSSDGSAWTLHSPVVSADDLNNELERPHMVRHAGAYYLFWSTQTQVFKPDGPQGPTGLYGMVSDDAEGPWRAVNKSGLIFQNPVEAPRQAYSWLVLPDLSVISFIDDWRAASDEPNAHRRFGGTFAPRLQLWVDGEHAGLVGGTI